MKFNSRTVLPRVVLAILIFIGWYLPAVADLIPATRLPAGGKWTPGIPGGIPTTGYTEWCNVKVSIPGSPLKAIGDGIADDTLAIQTAINLCPPNGIIRIPEGPYRVTTTITVAGQCGQPLRPMILRGDGPTKTKILSYATSGNLMDIVQCKGPAAGTVHLMGSTPGSFRGQSNFPAVWLHPMLGGNANNLSGAVGNWVLLNHFDLGSYWSQFSKVVRYATNTITIWPPLYSASTSTTLPVDISYVDTAAFRTGVEDLYIEQKVNHGGNGFFMKGAVECWLKNVESVGVYNWHVRLEMSTACEVRDSYFHDTHWPGSGGGNSAYGVGIRVPGSHHLIENNIFRWLRHSMLIEGGSGNVFGYNYSFNTINEGQAGTDYLMHDAVTHGLAAQYNLFEGNIAQRLNYDNAEWWEGLGGYCNTAYRNWFQRMPLNAQSSGGMTAMANQWQNYSNNIIGNIALTPWRTDTQGYFSDQPRNIIFGVMELDWWKDSVMVPTGNPDQMAIYNQMPKTSNSVIYALNYDFATKTNCCGVPPTDPLPNSYYLSTKPAWFGSLPWPAYGPDVAVKTNSIPALARYNGIPVGTNSSVRPAPPPKPRVVE